MKSPADPRSARTRSSELSVEVFVLAVVLVTIGVAASTLHWTRAVDDVLYDRVQRFAAPAIPEDVVIVSIDERSLNARGRWPWPRRELAVLIDRLVEAGARGVAIDIVLADPGVMDRAGDAVLAASVTALPIAVLPILIDSLGPGGQALEVLPIPALAEAGRLGHVHVEFDADGIARGIYLYQGVGDAFWPHFSLTLAQALGEARTERPETPVFGIRRVRAEYRRIPFRGAAGSVGQVSALDVLENDAVLPLLAGKTVFVGVIATAADDAVLTPGVGDGRPMSGVEFNAHVYSAIRTDRLITPIRWVWQVGLTGLLCILAPIVLPRLNPRWSLATTLLLAVVPVVAGLILLLGFRIWFAPVAALLTTLLTYPLWSWRRLEYAFRYLQSDLGLLEREADQLPVDTDQRDLAQSLEFIMDIHRLHGWGIYGANGAERRTPTAPIQSARLDRVGHWETRGSGIWLRLSEREQAAIVGVIATSALLEEPAVRDSLAHLADTFVERVPGRTGVYEAIGTLLRRLARTSSRVRVLRQVVVDSMAHMGDGMLMIDGFGQIALANEKAAFLARGDKLQRMIGLPLGVALAGVRLTNGGDWLDIARACLVGGADVEVDADAPNGRSLLVHAAQVNLGQPIGLAMIVNLVDITALRQAENQRSQTLAFLSHDLRSPMVSLLALVKRHRETTTAQPSDELLMRIESYARRNLDASDKFLQLARLQSGEKVEFYDFEVTDVLDNAMEQVYFQAADKDIAILSESHEGGADGIWLHGNAELLERALINLLDNAIKYSPAGSQIVASAIGSETRVVLEVTDQGYGIPESERASLFELFYRMPGSRTRRERGTGLGLPFVKLVAERHGGCVEIVGAPGKGSCFRIVLPVTRIVKTQ